jgi:hypothetical protein
MQSDCRATLDHFPILQRCISLLQPARRDPSTSFWAFHAVPPARPEKPLLSHGSIIASAVPASGGLSRLRVIGYA